MLRCMMTESDQAILSYWNNVQTRDQGRGHLAQANPDTLKSDHFRQFVTESSER